MEMLELTVIADFDGTRLDKYLSLIPELSVTRNAAQLLIGANGVTVNGKTAEKNTKLKSGDFVTVCMPEVIDSTAEAENIPLDIVYEDTDLLVVNKPQGMVVHPAPGNTTGTLVNALLWHCGDELSGINGVIRPGIVHRIDKNTGGLLIVAKNDFAHYRLAEQIKEHSFKREYRAILVGNLRDDSGTVDIPIGRSPKDRKKQAVNGLNARNAVTHYDVIKRYNGFCKVKCILETGRTHQIRVHMSYLGHPVAGDPTYSGTVKYPLCGQCLFAAEIGFIHPRTGRYIEFIADEPEWFIAFEKWVAEK